MTNEYSKSDHRPPVIRPREAGFTLIETALVVAIMMIAAAISLFSLPPALRAMRINSALQMTLDTLGRAHGLASANRCVYQVDFTLPNQITVTQTATGTVVLRNQLPPGVSFDAEPGIPSTPATTPDGFGSGAITGAVDFDADFGLGGATRVFFLPDGTARDQNGHINNGVVYLAQPGDLLSSRAVTLWGLTSHLKPWRLHSNSNTGVAVWGQP
ncbi:MAG: Tfp pilus assembly protein FimT/FimU [Actinomycetota bacterium]